jgi:mandelate racemase
VALILIDLQTEEGVVGRSYLEPYLKQSARYLVPAILDLAASRVGQLLHPIDDFRQGQKSLNLLGYEGMSLIAVSGLDMAVWDAMAKAADMPLAVFLGGSLGAIPAYNSNGLWLTDIATLGDEALSLVEEGGFKALKLRLGREKLSDDLDSIETVRSAVGGGVKLMVDFNQGLSLGDALHRCHALDEQEIGVRGPIGYDNLAGITRLRSELRTCPTRREFLWSPFAVPSFDNGCCRLRHAGFDAYRRRHGLVARGGDRRRCRHRDVHAFVPGIRCASHASHGDRALAGMAGLG